MSADNWALCPRCSQKIETAVAKVREQYGKLSADQYEATLALLQKKGREPDPTFREDYEFGISKTGEFSVSYSGRCTVCDLSYRHTFKQQVPIGAQ